MKPLRLRLGGWNLAVGAGGWGWRLGLGGWDRAGRHSEAVGTLRNSRNINRSSNLRLQPASAYWRNS